MNSNTLDQLVVGLSAYDGRDTKFLQALADRHAASADYADCLIKCFDRNPTTIADGASWLLLAHLRGGGDGGDGDGGNSDGDGDGCYGGDLTPRLVDGLIAQTNVLTSWAAQLHICQSLRLIPLDADQALALAEWLRPLLGSEKPFVRAWSLDAFLHVCTLLPSHAGEGRMALEAALNDPAASVRARARNLG